MSLKYEPSLEPLHISAKKFLIRNPKAGSRGHGVARVQPNAPAHRPAWLHPGGRSQGFGLASADRPASGQTGPPRDRQTRLRIDGPASGQTGPFRGRRARRRVEVVIPSPDPAVCCRLVGPNGGREERGRGRRGRAETEIVGGERGRRKLYSSRGVRVLAFDSVVTQLPCAHGFSI